MASVTRLGRTAVGPLLAATAGGHGSPAVAALPFYPWPRVAPMAVAPAAAVVVTGVACAGQRRGLHTTPSVGLQRIPGGGDGGASGGSSGGWPRAPPPPWVAPQAAPRGDALRRYTRDLTADATAGRLDPVVGREEEVRLVLQILGRRTKNNPALIGEPGTGKVRFRGEEGQGGWGFAPCTRGGDGGEGWPSAARVNGDWTGWDDGEGRLAVFRNRCFFPW